MTEISVRLDTAPIGAIMDRAAWMLEGSLAPAVLKAANFGGAIIAKSAQATHSADLGRSFLPATFVESSSGVAAGALSDHVAARILDQGGTIVPKTVKMLAVPVSKKAKNLWPRDWPKGDLALVKSKEGRGGRALLIGAKEKELVVHYILMHRVTIHPSYYLEAGIFEATPVVKKIMEEETYKAVSNGMSEG